MVATPEKALFVFEGYSGTKYMKHAYISDVANAPINWDSGVGANASSALSWVAPEPVALVDVSVVTGLAVIDKLAITRDDVPTGDIVHTPIHLTTLNNRPELGTVFMPGQKVGAIQLAI